MCHCFSLLGRTVIHFSFNEICNQFIKSRNTIKEAILSYGDVCKIGDLYLKKKINLLAHSYKHQAKAFEKI